MRYCEDISCRREVSTSGTCSTTDRIARNVPLDQMVRELLTASGGTFENPAASFYEVERDTNGPTEQTRGLVDGLLTTHESVRSAKLWDSGLKFAYDDNQAFFQYIPTMSKEKWDSLKPEHQKMIVESWAEMIPGTRKLAEDRQNLVVGPEAGRVAGRDEVDLHAATLQRRVHARKASE